MRELLVGVLVDVSGSMTSAIENRSGGTSTRLEAFRDSLEQLASRAARSVKAAKEKGSKVEMHLFAYGFGFGGLLSAIFGGEGADVRDLLALSPSNDSLVSATELADEWPRYRSHVEGLIPQMFGSTPMHKAFSCASERFERIGEEQGVQRVLLVVSDGEPSDGSPEAIAELARKLQLRGIFVVACYVTADDVTEPRRLYAEPKETWPPGARLMHACASPIAPNSPFDTYLREVGWTVDPGARLFAQVNQSSLLSEFMNVVLSPVQSDEGAARLAQLAPAGVSQAASDTKQPSRTRGGHSAETLVLFVHGLGGSASETWGRFPQLIRDDSELSERVEVGFYQFPTSLLRLPFTSKAPRIQELAAGLRTQIGNRYKNHVNVVLVCHSLGGLIARGYLIDEYKSGRRSPVSGLVLFAVPNDGAGLASVAQHLSWRHSQLRQLCKGTDLLHSLNEDWFVMKLHEKIAVRYVVAGIDAVVDVQGARGFWGNPNVETVIDKGHIDVAKPHDAEDLSYLLVRNFLIERAHPR